MSLSFEFLINNPYTQHVPLGSLLRIKNSEEKYKGQSKAYLKGAHQEVSEEPVKETRQQRRARERKERKS